MLIAAVRRVRSPGCKFDEMVVIENEEQGTDKSTMLATLAGREDWFSDDLPLNITGKQSSRKPARTMDRRGRRVERHATRRHRASQNFPYRDR